MVRSKISGALHPAKLETFKAFIPELFAYDDIHVDILEFHPMLDSSDINPDNWQKMAHAVYDNYNRYDGFVILHGTDTMSYSGSALSFMLDGLQKPVVFTGSQLPIGVLRSDAKENLLTAIEIAAAKDEEGNAIVPEVTVFFEDRLFRANRTTKKNAEHFSAFNSYNYPPLAKAGVHITYQPHLVNYSPMDMPLKLHDRLQRRRTQALPGYLQGGGTHHPAYQRIARRGTGDLRSGKCTIGEMAVSSTKTSRRQRYHHRQQDAMQYRFSRHGTL